MTDVIRDNIERGLVLRNKALVAEVFTKNGFSVLSSATGEEKTIEAGADQMDQGKGADDSCKIEHPLLVECAFYCKRGINANSIFSVEKVRMHVLKRPG